MLAVLRDHDPVVQRYHAFFAHLDWRAIPAREVTRRPTARPARRPTGQTCPNARASGQCTCPDPDYHVMLKPAFSMALSVRLPV